MPQTKAAPRPIQGRKEHPSAVVEKRAYPRWSAWVIPAILTSQAGETIPATILNLSASGLLALLDIRFAPSLRSANGTRLNGRFFLDDLEIRDLALEVVRTEDQGHYLVNIGCRFVETSAKAVRATSTKVNTLLSPSSRRTAPLSQPTQRKSRQRSSAKV